MNNKQYKFCVLGSGIWGTALAIQVSRVFNSCTIFTKNPHTFEAINNHHTNKGVSLPAGITAEINCKKLAEYQNIILAAPSYALADILPALEALPEGKNLLVATKGLDTTRTQLISQTLKSQTHSQILIFSGASFAQEVIDDQPTVINLASQDLQLANTLATQLSSRNFMVIASDNQVALELSGCIKNIVAIFVGILRGLSYGDNICSSVIAKGVQECKALSQKINPAGSFDTISLFSDIIMTCSSKKSRNMSFGLQLAMGDHLAHNLTEGVFAAEATLRLAQKYDIELKLLKFITACLNEPQKLRDKIELGLMNVFRQ